MMLLTVTPTLGVTEKVRAFCWALAVEAAMSRAAKTNNCFFIVVYDMIYAKFDKQVQIYIIYS